MKIRKGDTVKVLYGKDAGRQGKVVKVFRDEMKVVVEGVNELKKHVKSDGRSRKSEILTVVKPIPVSKVMLVDPVSGKPTRVRMENGSAGKQRISVRTKKPVDQKETPKIKNEEKKPSGKRTGPDKKDDSSKKEAKVKRTKDTKSK